MSVPLLGAHQTLPGEGSWLCLALCVTSGRSLALSEPQFTHLEHGGLEKLMLPGLARQGEKNEGRPSLV